jgi:hypothetical protein
MKRKEAHDMEDTTIVAGKVFTRERLEELGLAYSGEMMFGNGAFHIFRSGEYMLLTKKAPDGYIVHIMRDIGKKENVSFIRI